MSLRALVFAFVLSLAGWAAVFALLGVLGLIARVGELVAMQ